MKLYLDASALVKLYVDEEGAVALRSALVEPVAFASWDLALERAAGKAGLKPLRRTGQ